MRARIGDLAIARFDPSETDKSNGKRWDEKVCIVTESALWAFVGSVREYEFIYWDKVGKTINIHYGTLTPSRLVRARPKMDDWEGTLHSLTLDNVEPVR